ncbi:hypothetical protein [Ruegeria arenilitoris]|uniref:hypothetical protein n=1 Tax=Ruegeria arenilitoris TaxID=1173585 RepID=UPI00147B671D|nr:hypothetical protein [Ruegeria arenilitoris]
MEYVSKYSTIIPLLVEYFSLAKAGPYHPLQVRNDLNLSKNFWRVAMKSFVYPDGSEGRKALKSVGVNVVPEALQRLNSGKVRINSLFLKDGAGGG